MTNNFSTHTDVQFAHQQMVSDYQANDQQSLSILESLSIGVGQTETQYDNLTHRSAKALYAAEEWCRRGYKIFLGSYLFKSDVAEYFAARYKIIEFNIGKPLSDEEFNNLCMQLRGAMVVINSNELLSAANLQMLQKLYLRCCDTLFICWFFDNHHMIKHGASLSLCLDLIYPAHFDNIHILTRYCPFIRSVLPAGVISWTIPQAVKLEPLLYKRDRSVMLSGSYYHYEKFSHRNHILSQIMKQSVGSGLRFMNGETPGHYWQLSFNEQWSQWCESKCNIIVPTLADLPIRFFDALITGNIPLLPESIRYTVSCYRTDEINALPVVWYSHSDIDHFEDVVNYACSLFDKTGLKGIANRHRWVIKNHMCEHRLESIIDDVFLLVDAGR